MDTQEDAFDAEASIRSAARGWHGIQVGVFGLIGLCGALYDGGFGLPQWLRVVAGILVLAALALACVGTLLVARVAWPVTARPVPPQRLLRRLRTGIAVTFTAVVLLAVATSSSWWPGDAAAANLVEVTVSGGTLCGVLGEAEPGVVNLEIDGEQIRIPLSQVGSIRAVGGCP